jgi:LTXXQ motif family protein
MTRPDEHPLRAQQPREPVQAQPGQQRGEQRVLQGREQAQPPQDFGARQSRRSEHQARITPQAARQNRFAGQFLRDPAGRDQWMQVRRERWAPAEAWRHKTRAAFIPWSGPVFWPYAYADVFNYTFWPNAYDQSYWAFAYDDFFDAIFFPYGAPYVGDAYTGPYGSYNLVGQYDPGANVYYGSSKAAPPAGAVTQAARQLCAEPDSGIMVWPIQQIADTVQPSNDQSTLLDGLRTAAAKAADVFRNSCPTAVPMTPISRLQVMIGRLQATLDAIAIVKPALEEFYESLTDEQRARFDAMQADVARQPSQTENQQAHVCADAKPGLADLPLDRIDEVVQPTGQQQDALARLSDATQKAVETIQAACPNSTPLTPVGRLEAMAQRLNAMLAAAEMIQPALEEFYGSLSYEQRRASIRSIAS